jgi:branched-chain amino acid transport system substrate-binding protein
MKSNRLPVLAAIIAAALLLPGALAQGSLKVAVVGPYSGFESFIGPDTLKGVQLATDLINQSGGVMGQKVEVSTGDTTGDAIDAVPAMQKVVNVNHVNGLVGPSSVTIQAALPFIKNLDIVDVMVGGTTALDNNALPNLFRTTPSDSLMGVAMAYYAHQKGFTRAAVVFGTNASAQSLKAPVVNTFKQAGGTIVADVGISPGQSSYRSEILKIYAAKPDVVFFQLDPGTGGTYFKEVTELEGTSVPYVGTDVTASADFIKAVGVKTADAMITSIQGSSSGGSGAGAFNSAYQKKYGGKPVELANYGYDAMNVLALAWQKAGTTSGSKVFQAMHDVASPPGTVCTTFADCSALLKSGQAVNYEGASGPVDFNQYGNVTAGFEAVKVDTAGNAKLMLEIGAKALEPYLK